MEFTLSKARMWSRLGQRGTICGVILPELAKTHENLWVITADLGLLSGLDRFRRENPGRFINTGIAEQNMIGVAAGLAMEGNLAFATTYASFITMRAFEQIRHNLGYQKCNIKLIGSAAGLAMGMSGNTHYAMEDIALMRTVPNMTVLSPADSVEAAKMTEALAESDDPAYMRLTGGLNCPMVYHEDYDFQIGRGIVLKEGKDAALIASGTMVSETLKAAELLEKDGVSCTIVDMHTIKPLDMDLLRRLFASHSLIVTIEEHSVIGGLGGAVAEAKAGLSNMPPQLILGLPDAFGKAADGKYLLEQYGLTAGRIAEKIRDVLS